jgi:hypothetical protein
MAVKHENSIQIISYNQFLATLIFVAIVCIALVSADSVTLQIPLNNSLITNNSNLTFDYQIVSTFELKNTSLFIYSSNGTFYNSQDRIYLPFSNMSADNLSIEFNPFPVGNYTWYANLYDIYNSSTYSENRTFEIYQQEIVVLFNPFDSDIYLILQSAGAGLGIFLQIISATLPLFLIFIATIVIIIKIFQALEIEKYFRNK